MREVIQMLVLSHIDHGPAVWSSASAGNLKQLQVIQNKAPRMVLHCGLQSNVVAMHVNLSWLDVKSRLHY